MTEQTKGRSETDRALVDEQFAKAIRHRDEGDFAAARDTLLELATEARETATIHLMLGDVHESLGDLEAAEASHAQAVQLNPRSELASISLFHVLFDLNRRDEAETEMSRFLKLGKESPLYDALVADQRPQRDKRG